MTLPFQAKRRPHKNLTAVALAYKNAPTMWLLLAHECMCDPMRPVRHSICGTCNGCKLLAQRAETSRRDEATARILQAHNNRCNAGHIECRRRCSISWPQPSQRGAFAAAVGVRGCSPSRTEAHFYLFSMGSPSFTPALLFICLSWVVCVPFPDDGAAFGAAAPSAG